MVKCIRGASVMFCSTSGPFKLAGMDIFLKVSAAYGFVKGSTLVLCLLVASVIGLIVIVFGLFSLYHAWSLANYFRISGLGCQHSWDVRFSRQDAIVPWAVLIIAITIRR